MKEQKTDVNLATRKRVQNTEQIDLLELAVMLLRRWYVLLIALAVGAACAFIYSKFIVTPIYSSTSKLYIFSSSTSLTSLSDIQLSSSLTSDYVELITNRPVMEQVIDNLGLNLTYTQLKSKTSVTNPSSTHMLYITIKDADPQMAKVIADEYADVASQAIGEMMNQDPPNIISYGYSDGKPVNVEVKKAVLIGALIGFVLAAAVLIVMHLLNDSVQSPDDFGTKVQINLLGTLPLEQDLVNFDHVQHRKHKTE